MAQNSPLLFICFSLLVTSSLHCCFGFKCSKKKNLSPEELDWSLADATWYGNPNGAGSDGGACAYGNIVGQPPFSSMVSAGGPSLFKGGKGCGTCYQVKCISNPACSGNPVTVVITDSCPGGPCLSQATHFDMSGTAFGAMAVPGQAGQLRNVGIIQVEYTRVACNYTGQNMNFYVDSGSNPYYLSVVVQYANGDGDLGAVELKETPYYASETKDWIPMQQSWGANWKLNSALMLQPPFSFRLTSLTYSRSLVTGDVIPVGWEPGKTYSSIVNFSINSTRTRPTA